MGVNEEEYLCGSLFYATFRIECTGGNECEISIRTGFLLLAL